MSVFLSIMTRDTITNTNQVIAGLKSLKDKCVLPDTPEPYIKSITAGVDNSIEGLQVRATNMRLFLDGADALEIHRTASPI